MLHKHKCIAKDIIDLAHEYGADKASVSLANSTSFQVDVREKKNRIPSRICLVRCAPYNLNQKTPVNCILK